MRQIEHIAQTESQHWACSLCRNRSEFGAVRQQMGHAVHTTIEKKQGGFVDKILLSIWGGGRVDPQLGHSCPGWNEQRSNREFTVCELRKMRTRDPAVSREIGCVRFVCAVVTRVGRNGRLHPLHRVSKLRPEKG